MSHDSTPTAPTWALLLVYILILAILGFVGDFFTFVVGFLVITLVFASAYNKEHLEEH
ncbi:MAG: hypothetical protein ACK4LB_00870 [Spirosomataceae bacterium]